MKEFEYDAEQSFRAWLKTVATNKVRDLMARRQLIAKSEAKAAKRSRNSDVDVFAEREYRTYVIRRTLRLIEKDFDKQTSCIFRELVLQRRSPADVAAEFNVSRNTVYLAKSRVMRRLRERLARLID
jgi:RNA polymerase sigma-70 factor (ECF subfamily)